MIKLDSRFDLVEYAAKKKSKALALSPWLVALLLPLAVGCSRGNLSNPLNSLPPGVQKVFPETGSLSGGTKIAIAGTNFVQGAKVTLGDVECQDVQVLSTSALSCTTPAYRSPAQVDVVVINPNKLQMKLVGGFTYAEESTPVAGAGISAGGQKATSSSYSTDVRVGFVGSTSPIQRSASFTHLPGSAGSAISAH